VKGRATVTTCYLCGGPLDADRSDDHVPPKQFFPEGFRKASRAVQLDTVPVHPACNKAFQSDEDYFVTTLAGFAANTTAGSLAWRDVNRRFRRPQGVTLGRMVLREFEHRPSGIILPPGKIGKRFQRGRIDRVIWKVVRGLYFLEHRSILPARVPHYSSLVLPGDQPPKPVLAVVSQPEKGRYPTVFAYRFKVFTEAGGLQLWVLFLWDCIGCWVAFHDPECRCAKCLER
jgi:hypothetical protein